MQIIISIVNIYIYIYKQLVKLLLDPDEKRTHGQEDESFHSAKAISIKTLYILKYYG